jgi:hypothetical protein
MYNEFLILITMELSNINLQFNSFSVASFAMINLEANLEPWIRTLKKGKKKHSSGLNGKLWMSSS